ncbi:30S ribosomal protein S18 [Candidatus Persebacteraceae bacterium Df01]|jgi:small subunit ribosomal protein S18|uniref:Small ribosomal subunit protein bS18 n=1 Tax=Candidatus Doriopsillibacter californiensis TaxID=2970740 RepID=A0ABT7QN72_9GAMM|nr:30S ribosomal protein S18 [Candidatus Persebacteraceae bacterium Df01]
MSRTFQNRPFRKRKKTAQSMQRAMFRKPPSCPLLSAGITQVDYKDIDLLSRHITEEARIQPSAYSNVCAKMQRQLKRAIKQARFLSLLPYSRSHTLRRDK